MRVKAWTVSEGEVVRREQQKLHNEIRPNLTLKNKIGIIIPLINSDFGSDRVQTIQIRIFNNSNPNPIQISEIRNPKSELERIGSDFGYPIQMHSPNYDISYGTTNIVEYLF